jgi:hypothetical protein
MKWMSSDGQWVVELIHLTATRGQEGDWLRVTHHGFYIGKARDSDGVAARLPGRSGRPARQSLGLRQGKSPAMQIRYSVSLGAAASRFGRAKVVLPFPP